MAGIAMGIGAGVLVFDALHSKGQSLTITNNIVTNMTVNATSTSVTDCFSGVSGSQTIDIATNGAYPWQNNTSCDYCLQKITNEILKERQALEQQAELASGSSYTAQKANPILETALITGGEISGNKTNNLGPCDLMCNDVLVHGVQQSQSFNAKSNCTVTNNFKTSIQQNLKAQITSFLKNDQDILGQLGGIFSSNQDSIATNLSNTLSENITNKFSQTLSQQMSNTQSFILGNTFGHSIYADNISQSFKGSQVGNLTVTNTVLDQMRQSAAYNISQTLVNKNDTIGDLSKKFVQIIEDMADLMETLTGQMLIIIGALILLVILVMGSLYVFSSTFRGLMNKKALGEKVDMNTVVGAYAGQDTANFVSQHSSNANDYYEDKKEAVAKPYRKAKNFVKDRYASASKFVGSRYNDYKTWKASRS